MAAAAVAALLLGACSDDTPEAGFEGLPEESESAEPSPNASAEAATDEIDVTTTPDEITPEWVTAVVNTLLAEYGEMEAEILAEPPSEDPTLPAEVEARTAELFQGEYLARRLTALQHAKTNADGYREALLPAPEFLGLRFNADTLKAASDQCIVAVGRISREFTVPSRGPLDTLSAVSLAPTDQTSDSTNPTGWVLIDELGNYNPNGEPNPDSVMLDAEIADFGSALDTNCESS